VKISDIEVNLVDSCGNDLSVVNAARVSFDKESDWEEVFEFDIEDGPTFKLKQEDAKLVNYLAKHKHFSPFNHSFISVRVKAPVFVARQLVKHKFMPWNEVSRRYVDSEPEFYLPKYWRKRAENVKQGSKEESVNICDEDGYNPAEHNIYCLNELYKDLLKANVCPEQARMMLPQNTMTEWIWSGTLGAFASMLKLRLDEHTQYETRIVAEKVKEIITPLFPVSLNALLENV